MAIDLIVYQLLLFFFPTMISVSKIAGFLFGSVFSYLVNNHWTFKHKKIDLRSMSGFVVLYCTTMFTNVATNSLILEIAGAEKLQIYLAFFLSTGVSAFLNYFGMKHIVFKQIK